MDMGDGRLDALVLKLRHPLAKIRSRALRSLLFKLRERLVQWQELEPLQTALVPSLLACLEPPLELDALHVLQLMMQSDSDVFLSSLHHFGAAQKLQRAAQANPELQATYEKLLRQIYASKVVLKDDKKEVCSRTGDEDGHIAASLRTSETVKVLPDVQRDLRVDKLEAFGWRFAPVTLLSVDEQHLFEFEVKLQLKTNVQDIVKACATFRNELLRNFPAEVFLQRPTVLQYLLHLVQQPILPDRPGMTWKQGKGADVVMEKAMSVSMGVNYFDDMLNATCSSTQGNVASAVVMASLKAIESLLYALQRTRRVCLDPTYIVHSPTVHVQMFDSYDTRRVLYPRARVEIDEGAVKQRVGDSANQLSQYSLSGATYRVFMSVLPLLRSARHPRQHFLNLLIVAIPDLPERSRLDVAELGTLKLNKLRLECIFGVLCVICRPLPPEHTCDSMADNKLEFTHSITWKLVELVLRLLRLFLPSKYCVEVACGKAEGCDLAEDNRGIIIPRQLWETVKSWIAHPAFLDVSAREWKNESLIQNLSQIDSTIPAFVNLKQSSLHDAKSILAFVEFAKVNREQSANVSSPEEPVTATLQVARKVVQARCIFNDSDTEIIAYAVLDTIWSALANDGADKTGTISASDMEYIRFILCYLLSASGELETLAVDNSMAVHFFRGFSDLLDKLSNGASRVSADCWHQFATHVICEPNFLALLMLVLARSDVDPSDETHSVALWGILRASLMQLANVSSVELRLLEPVIPLMQHYAYMELPGGSCREQRLTKPQLVEVLNRVESVVPDHTRMLVFCRCLLHESSYIRKAASSRVIRLLSLVTSSDADHISTDKAICEDPFGCAITSDGKTINFEATLMETPLPVVRASEYRPHGSELSSQLRKLAHLCKVILGTSSAFETMREAALKELVMFIEQSSVELFTLLEELDKLSDLLDLLRSFLQMDGNRHHTSMVHRALILLRTLLFRSPLLRAAVRHDSSTIEVLMSLIFHTSVLVRAQMYYVVLLLMCSAENFVTTVVLSESLSKIEPGLSGEANVPEMIKTTFGLYSDRWARCHVVTCSLKQQLKATCAQVIKQPESLWLQEVKAVISKASFHSDEYGVKRGTSGENVLALLGTEYSFVTRRLRDAPSNGKCLNALYYLMMICESWSFARERFVKEWEMEFERYFAVPPKSERDEMIIGSLMATLSTMFFAMTRGVQLRALVMVKRKVLPLLKKSQSKLFSLQTARFLLTVSESKVGDLFLSLAADTDIIATICTKYSTTYSTEPVLHSLMLEVLLRFAKRMSENVDTRLSAPSCDKISKRLLEMLSPLLTVVCRHRVPGSFLERDVFTVASQCIASILLLLPRNSLLVSDCHLEHTDSSILLDGSWASRFLFDHVSPVRELGFLVLEHTLSSDISTTRLLKQAFEASIDDTEADAVRAAACAALTKAITRYLVRPSDEQVGMPEIPKRSAFSGKTLRSLSHMLKCNKLCARACSAFARLVRLLYVHRNSLALILGDMQKELQAAEEEYEVYSLLVQVRTR
uniref:Rotatin N-terminal domain-containing protein n=1 Tax=Hyaloperonospora arabidopsidis (strain Emoy2) TaxID=559515 RepID=M4BGJ4_HYAAE